MRPLYGPDIVLFPLGGLGDFMTIEGAGELGDVACSPEEARAGESSVARMNKVFSSIGSPPAYKPYVDDINARFAEYKSWRLSMRSQLAIWCDAKALGVEAEALTAKMAASASLAPPIHDPNLDPGVLAKITTALKWGAALLAIGGTLYIGSRIYDATRARRQRAMAGARAHRNGLRARRRARA